MKLFCSNRFLLSLIAILSVAFISGCGRKQIREDAPIAQTGLTNPVQIGQQYIQKTFDPANKTQLYNLFTQESQALLSFTEFSQRIDELSKLVDTRNAFISVIPINAFLFSNDKMVVYYLMLYEKDLAGVYSVAELYFVQDMGVWKIELQQDDGAVSALPVIRQGDIVQLNRKELQFINDDIDNRITQFARQFQQPQQPVVPVVQEPEVIQEESAAEKTARIVKKEMIIGKTYYDVGDYDRAVISFERVIGLQPDYPEAQLYLKKTLSAIQQKEEEIKAQQEAAEKAKEKPVVAPVKEQPKPEPLPVEKSVEDTLFDQFFASGKKSYDDGDYRKAIVHFQKAVNIKPDDLAARQFIEKCEKAIQVAPSR